MDPIARARELVGTRFRPQGRSAETGLDCIGLVIAAFDLPSAAVRRDYALRGGDPDEVEKALGRWFHRVEAERPGDLRLVRPGPAQLHLLLLTGGGYIHGDARVGRIVEAPGEARWPVLSRWRYRDGNG